MKKIIILLLTLNIPLIIYGQKQHEIDSLSKIVDQLTGLQKIKVLRDLCYYTSFSNHENALNYCNQAITYSKSIEHQLGLGKSFNEIGSIYLNAGDFDKALIYYDSALSQLNEKNDLEDIAFVKQNIGATYKNKGEFSIALTYLIESVELKKKLGNTKLYSSLLTIGEVFRMQKDYDKALAYYEESLEFAKKRKLKGAMADAMSNMEIIYRKRGNYDKALFLRTEAIELAKEEEDIQSLAINYNNLGELYFDLKKYDLAIENLEKSMKLKKQLNSMGGITYTAESLAETYLAINKFEKAISFGLLSLNTAMSIGDKYKQMDAYKTLSEIYQKSKKFEQSLNYHIQYNNLKDSLFNERKNLQLHDLETKYQTSEKQAENALLKIASLEQRNTINQKNYLLIAFCVGLLLLIVLIVVIFKAYKNQSKTSNILSIQKEELAQLNTTKNRFFGIIAHDLRGPLTALQGITGLLSYNIRKNDTKSLNAIAQQIEDSALKVNLLLDNLLKWALSQEKMIAFNPQSLALKSLVDENINYFKEMAQAKQININVEIPYKLHVHADKETMSTVIRNLVNNSIKFTPKGGSIILKANQNNEKVQIDISDNGKGIEEVQLKNIFMLNNNGPVKSSSTEKGTGLGLVLVHDFVQLNQGSISVISEVDHGSTFSIKLPGQLANVG